MTEPVVRLEGLTKRFGAFEAVHQLTLEVYPGEIFTLLGPNGAGKTTTIRMLTGILKPTSGSARIGGCDCFRERPEAMRRLGYVPDEPVFYDFLRGREILNFVGEMHGLTSQEILERSTALTRRLELSDALFEYAVNYSRGMKKKLALVCALLHQPEVLILDEPTNGLDPFATRTMHELMRELAAAGKAVFFSTHLLDQAEKLCHRVAIMHRSRLAACGRLEELRAGIARNSTLEEVFFAVARDADPDAPPLADPAPPELPAPAGPADGAAP